MKRGFFLGETKDFVFWKNACEHVVMHNVRFKSDSTNYDNISFAS